MGKYFRSVQEINRSEPEYKYIVEIRSSAGILGGFDVTVQGFQKGTDHVDDNGNFLSEWFWRRPPREKLFELVDRLHISVRSSMSEKDWSKIEEERIAKEMEKLREEMRRSFESELERKLKDKAKEVRDEIEKDKPEI